MIHDKNSTQESAWTNSQLSAINEFEEENKYSPEGNEIIARRTEWSSTYAFVFRQMEAKI